MDVVFGFFSLLLDSEWLRTQFDAHPRDMWMFTAVVFVLATGVGYLMGVTYGRFRYVRVEKERDMANERVFQLEVDLRTLKGDAEALRSAIDAMHEDARHTSDALAAERERVFELEAQLVDQEARHAEGERLKRKASMEKMERESARSCVMSLGADDKRLLRRLAQGPLTTTFLGRSSFDATVRGVRRGVEFTEVDRDFIGNEASYRLALNDFGKLAAEAGAELLALVSDDDLEWLELR